MGRMTALVLMRQCWSQGDNYNQVTWKAMMVPQRAHK